MKKFLKNTAVLSLLFATTAAMATEPKIALKTGDEAKSLVLEMDATLGESEVRMTDSNDNIVHYENVLKSSYTKKFNLKDLKNGTYYFTVENPVKKVTFTIGVKTSEIKIHKRSENPQIPVLTKSGHRIYFNLLNQNMNTVRVKVLNGHNETVEEQIFRGDLTVGKVYNFENAIADDYRVIVQDGKNVYRLGISVQ